MATPMSAQQYAQTLIQRYNEMRTLLNDEEKLYQYFLGAIDAIPDYMIGSEVAKSMRESYEIAEKALFPPGRYENRGQHAATTETVAENPLEKSEQQQSESEREKRPTPRALFQAWQEGGEQKLEEMLPDEPEEDEQ